MKQFLLRLAPAPMHLAFRSMRSRMRAAGWYFLPFIDPTLAPPPGYTKHRAKAIYGETFRRCFEYLDGQRLQGDILEFGTLRGYTARTIAMLMSEFRYPAHLYLYDSFEGLPDIQSPVDQGSYEVSVSKVWFRRQMALEHGIDTYIEQALSRVIPASQLSVVKGYFEDTLDTHLPATKATLIHIDCDLYSSTHFVLDKILEKDLLQDGALLLFDDFNCNRANPLMGERRALAETFGAQDRFSVSPFFSYGWSGQAFFVHDAHAFQEIARQSGIERA